MMTKKRTRRRHYRDKLALAGCRVCSDGSAKDTQVAAFPVLSSVCIASRSHHGVALCRVEPPTASFNPNPEDSVSSSDGTALCYDDSVQIVPWGSSEEELKASHGDDMNKTKILEAIRSVSVRRYRASFEDDDTKTVPLVSLPTTGKFLAVVCHEQLEEGKASGEDDHFVAIHSSFEAVVPLVSLRIRQLNIITTTTDDDHSNTLWLANIKRQLAGIHIAFREGVMTTKLRLSDHHALSRTEINFVVESASSAAGTEDAGALLYMIMPSTRISIVQEKPPTEPPSIVLPNNNCNDTSISEVSTMIIQTVQCLRGAQKAPVPRSFLLSGPPGVGKTFAVKRAYELCQTSGPTLLESLGSLVLSSAGDGGPGEVCRVLTERFEKAAATCDKDADSVAILFVDECDSLLQSEMVAAVFSSLLDQTTTTSTFDRGWQRIVVVAATNHTESLPSFLRRPGRLDQEIHVKPPAADERAEILQSLMASNTMMGGGRAAVSLRPDALRDLAELCVGYVAADLVALVRQVLSLALEEQPNFVWAPELFQRAMVDVRASSLRGAASFAPPKVRWNDIGSDPAGAQDTLRQAIEWPRTKREAFQSLGLQSPGGILLYGPPGCAKTTLARAAAGAAGTAFVSFSPSDVYASSYLGEAEAVIRRAFKFARSASPCILFFDEIDSILDGGGASEYGTNRSGGAESRVLSTFLNEMDGVDGSSQDGVLVLGATNRPWTLDAALMRSGRFDKAIYVPPPDYPGRLSILRIYCRGWDISEEELEEIASDRVSAMMTGAEIVGACHAAALLALKQSVKLDNPQESVKVAAEHLTEVFRATQPFLSSEDDLAVFLDFERSRKSQSSSAGKS
ncbi:Spermatogenesis-associated protein 5-like protein 1 [Seminavis robusta]|uniref:Spermatogenesis-associated protein 5-like protein 1 n=1 Tax=Seminavis robusta TaxID=568900 RepID=A0A9N8DVG0_9STRA|nr:Spermatogenesis-associated protein 5-like protein 1 [Seminavis robusta]|eukprot:Sro387_g132160.1 Spermatogenesis-associated protein 5-like protein 1 (852) ;mRNA; r:50820-53668